LFDIKLQYLRYIHIRAKAVDVEADIRYTGHFTKSIENLCWTSKRRKRRWLKASYQELEEEEKEEARKVDADW